MRSILFMIQKTVRLYSERFIVVNRLNIIYFYISRKNIKVHTNPFRETNIGK